MAVGLELSLPQMIATDDGFSAMNELDYFTDSECTKFAGRTIVAPPQESDYDGSGANTCISVKGHGAQWGSVRQHLD